MNDKSLTVLIAEFKRICIEISENTHEWGFKGTLDEALERARKANELGEKIKELIKE